LVCSANINVALSDYIKLRQFQGSGSPGLTAIDKRVPQL